MGFIQSLRVRQEEFASPVLEKPTVFPVPVQTQAPIQTAKAPAVIETRPPPSTIIEASPTPVISKVSNSTNSAAANTTPVSLSGANGQAGIATTSATVTSLPETTPEMAGGDAVSSDRSAVIGGSIAGVVIFLFLLFLLYRYRRRILLFFRPKPEDPEEPSFVNELQRETTRLSRFEDRCGGTSVSDGRPQTASTVRELRTHYSFATSVPTLAESTASSQRSGQMTLPPPQKPREVRYRLPLYHMEDDSYDNIELDPCERLEPPSPAAAGTAVIRQGPCRTPSSASARDGAAVALAWWQASGTCESPKARYSYLEAKKCAPVPVVPELRTPSRAEVCDDRTMSIASSLSGVMIEEGSSSVMGTTRSPSARSDGPSSVFSQRSDSFVSAASSFENYRRGARDGAAVGGSETDNDTYGDDHEDLDFEMLTEGDSTIIAVATTSARSSIQEIDVTTSKPLLRAQTLSGEDSPHCSPTHSKDQGPVIRLREMEAEQTEEIEEECERDIGTGYQDEDDGYESSVIEEDYEAVPSVTSADAHKLSIEQGERERIPEALATIRESRELLTYITRDSFLPEMSFEQKGFEFGFP